METRILHRFAVKGVGSFPVDMLRYDCCFPDDQDSAAKIMNSMSHSFSPKRDGKIYLAAYHPKGWQPTTARWSSFLWEVEV